MCTGGFRFLDLPLGSHKHGSCVIGVHSLRAGHSDDQVNVLVGHLGVLLSIGADKVRGTG